MSVLARLHERYGRHVEESIRRYLTSVVPEDARDLVLYQVETGGKRIRPMISLLFAEACGHDFRRALPAASIVELIHNYSLIYDDIIDRSVIRRGRPTTWRRFGHSMAILIGIWYREAIERAILDSPDPVEFSRRVSRTIGEITDGERLDILMELSGRDDPYVVDSRVYRRVRDVDKLIELYYTMIGKKTASLFETSSALGVLSVTRDETYVRAAEEYGRSVGIAFQLIDDLLDVFGEEEKFGKEVGKDIREHKLGNSVVLYALRELDERRREQLIGILSKPFLSDDDVAKAVEIISSTSARDVVIREAERHARRAAESVKVFPVSERARELVELAEFIVRREF